MNNSEPNDSSESDFTPRHSADVWDHIARERRQIGYDLHDGLLQQIIGAGMLLEALRYRIVGGHITTEKDILHISQILDGAIKEGRTLIRQLEHNQLECSDSLDVLLKSWISNLEQQTKKIHFRLQIAPELERQLRELSPKVTGHLLALVREGTANIVKHSKATEALISLQPFPTQPIISNSGGTPSTSKAILIIRDNGRGLNIGELWDEDQKNHFGLSSMQHRAESIGGTFSLQSAPGQGTELQIRFPLE